MAASLRWTAALLWILSIFALIGGVFLILIGIVSFLADGNDRLLSLWTFALGAGCIGQWALFRGISAAMEMIAEIGLSTHRMQSRLAKLEKDIET